MLASIHLPQAKPVFASSNFQNGDESVIGDDLELSNYINQQLTDIASRSTVDEINFINRSTAPDAWILSGKYKVLGEDISVKINIRQNKTSKYLFEESGTKANLTDLAAKIVRRATEWILKK